MFYRIQTFPYKNVRALKYIEIRQTTFLIQGIYVKETPIGSQYSSPSQLMIVRYDPTSNFFHFHSSLPASGVTDFECFTVGRQTYLTVANYRDNLGNLDIFSFVYLYNEQLRGFELTEYIETHGARDIEHFVLANEDYLVVANEATGTINNKTFDSFSDVYHFSNGKFRLIQSLETYGAIKWKSVAVPNCKHDVLLVYADQRNNVDQVGVYSFSHDRETFSAMPFSIFHLDIVNDMYRPQPLSLATFSIQDFYTGEFSLYLIIGANDTSQGSTIYQLSYAVILTDSPLDAFQRNVQVQLKLLNGTLNKVKRLLNDARDTLAEAVFKTGEQTITGQKTFSEQLTMNYTDFNRINITEGSILYSMDNKTYRADPAITQYVSLTNLESSISRHNDSINDVLGNQNDFMYLDVAQNVSGSMQFHNVEAKDVTIDDLRLTDNIINNINVTFLAKDIVLKNQAATISGSKTFNSHLMVNDSIVMDAKINNLNFKNDICLNGVDQFISSRKIFHNHVKIFSDFRVGTMNDIDLKDIVLVNKPAFITGMKEFSKSLHLTNSSISFFNTLDLHSVFSNIVTKSTDQTISGYKIFDTVLSNDNVLTGLINQLDLNILQGKVADSLNSSIIYGEKIFTDNITILNDLDVQGYINDLKFPDHSLMKSSNQLISAVKHFHNTHFMKDVLIGGLVDGVNTSELVRLDSDDSIHGFKGFSNGLNVNGNFYIKNNFTVNKIDLSNFVQNILTTDGNESLSVINFAEEVTLYDSKITGYINNDTFGSLEVLYNSSLKLIGDQSITGIKQLTNVTIANNLKAQYINNFRIPEDFARQHGDQVITGFKVFKDEVMFNKDLFVNKTLNGIDIKQFSEDIITYEDDQTINGVTTFYGNVYLNGSLITTGSINGIDLSEDAMFLTTGQNVTGAKRMNIVKFVDLHITVMKDINVETTIDGVDLSELDLSGMTLSRNETITGSKCFEQTDYNRSVSYINGIDLSALKEDIVTINSDQVITAMKTFETVLITKNLNTISTIDGIDVSELNETVVSNDDISTITGTVIFNNDVTMTNTVSAELFDNVNITNIDDILVSKSQNETITNFTITENVIADDMKVTNINGISMETDIVYTTRDQIIDGYKRFHNITLEKLTVNGLINNINLTTLQQEVLYKDTNQIVTGQKNFMDYINVQGDLNVNLINQYNISNWNLARTKG